MSLHEALRQILADKALDLFAAYDVACTPSPAPPITAARQLCGILGFTGERLCGSVVISATEDAIAASNPIGDGATRAWVAELTNQLVGRFKNAVFRCGVEVAMSVPVVLTATQLTPLPPIQLEPLGFAVGPGFLTIWLEIEPAPGLELLEPTPESDIAPEGESMMF